MAKKRRKVDDGSGRGRVCSWRAAQAFLEDTEWAADRLLTIADDARATLDLWPEGQGIAALRGALRDAMAVAVRSGEELRSLAERFAAIGDLPELHVHLERGKIVPPEFPDHVAVEEAPEDEVPF